MARTALGVDPTARLVAPVRPAPATFDPATVAALPPGWRDRPGEAGVLARNQANVTGQVRTGAGTYDVWLAGAPDVSTYVAIDGSRPFALSGEPQAPDQSLWLGQVRLTAGEHDITLGRFTGDSLIEPVLGPVAFTPQGAGTRRLTEVPAARYATLCAQTVDWVDAVRGA